MAMISDETYDLQLYWTNRREDPEQCAARFARMINGMQELDATFHQWRLTARTRKEAMRPPRELPADARQLQTTFLDNRMYYDVPPDKPWPELGFLFSIWNTMDDPFRVLITVHAGAYGTQITRPNSVKLELSRRRLKTDRPWQGSELRDLVSLLVEAWDADEASVNCFRYFPYLICTKDGKCLLPSGGWLTYLSPQQVAQVTAPGAVHVDRLGNGGAILTLCEEPFTIDNPRHLELAASLNAALRPIQALPAILG